MTDTALFPTLSQPRKSTADRTALIFAALILYLALWATAVIQFGVPGLYLPALAKVPVMFTILFLITKG